MNNKVIIALCTCPDRDTARRLAIDLVEGGLAACVNLVPGLGSVYRWEERIEESEECLILAKTAADGFGRLRDRLRERHPYELPEIVAVPVVDGLAGYLDRVTESTAGLTREP